MNGTSKLEESKGINLTLTFRKSAKTKKTVKNIAKNVLL